MCAFHPWDITLDEAIQLQRKLGSLVVMVNPESETASLKCSLIAGVDTVESSDGTAIYGGVVIWDREKEVVVEQSSARTSALFPYIPGLLAFRELPAIIRALEGLERTPHAVICDGHGLAHPRRFGLACHLGVLLNISSIGCAKNLLTGNCDQPGHERGEASPIIDGNEIIGVALRTQRGVKPVYVSIGNRVSLEEAVSIVLTCTVKYRLPEPIRMAHRLVTELRRGES
ncbi:MAG: endonuclease V [Spirochaetes bacterium]|nr:MAG: endonuclease V [Spirochaetota bacterium]